jgi:hypothetical protein
MLGRPMPHRIFFLGLGGQRKFADGWYRLTMKVEIIRCARCLAESQDGKAFAGAAAMLTGVSEVEASMMLTGVSKVEAQYVGFDAKRLPSVPRAIIRDLRKDHPGIGCIRIPSSLGGSPWDFGTRPKALEEMRAFLAGVECDDYKIIAFDGGEDDAEANGYCAIMMATSFDYRAHLDANGLPEVVIEA